MNCPWFQYEAYKTSPGTLSIQPKCSVQPVELQMYERIKRTIFVGSPLFTFTVPFAQNFHFHFVVFLRHHERFLIYQSDCKFGTTGKKYFHWTRTIFRGKIFAKRNATFSMLLQIENFGRKFIENRSIQFFEKPAFQTLVAIPYHININCSLKISEKVTVCWRLLKY